jgi:hypothetical protein
LNYVAQTALTQNKPLIYREGAVIVREKLETVASSPELLTAMIKRKKGFNPEANDWEFLVISGDAKKITKREKTGSCLGCHKSVSEKDFVFDSYLPTSTTVLPVMRPAMLRFDVREFLVNQPSHIIEF